MYKASCYSAENENKLTEICLSKIHIFLLMGEGGGGGGNREWGLINIFNFNGELIEGGGGGGLSRDNTAFIFSLQFWIIVYYSINHPVTSPCTSFSFSLVNNTLIQAFS